MEIIYGGVKFTKNIFRTFIVVCGSKIVLLKTCSFWQFPIGDKFLQFFIWIEAVRMVLFLKISLVLSLLIISIKCGQINYLMSDDLDEDDSCKVDDEIYGNCMKLSQCHAEFEKYKMHEINLNICKFTELYKDNLVCCPTVFLKNAK